MKKLKSIRSKIIMFIFAIIFPLSATGLVYSFVDTDVANADNTSSTNYYSGYMSEVSMTNNNFNSSSSTYSISTSLSGWTGQMTDKRSTAGIINTGNSFQNYMSGTYHLSKNPLAKASDKQILMINSKTDSSESYATSRQGYKSSSISLEANSFYTFQASFKSDTNYNSYTSYVKKGAVDNDLTITKATFETKGFNQYISFTYLSKTYYLNKTLSEAEEQTTQLDDVNVFYEDSEYIGFMKGSNAVYVSINEVEKISSNVVNVLANAQLYTCNLNYNSTASNYTVSAGTDYYTTTTEYSSLNDYVYGSMYLSGLTDENGKTVEAQYVKVTSKEWVTFYFFVATGNNTQTVSMDLWLGTNVAGHESSGAVFFDDCHVYQYSENSFWKTYQSYYGKNYTQEITDSTGNTEETTFDCVNLVDLRTKELLSYSNHNLDFEEGTYNDDLSSLKNWTRSGSGNAQVFNVQAPQYFKDTTGYDFVGSNLSCDVTIGEENVSITSNNYVLGLWANKEYIKVKSNNIDINSNEIYKVKAFYKISELSTGNVYMTVEENDTVLKTYNISDKQYTLKTETASSAVTSNGSSNFTNNYGTIEFYIKGGSLYDSSVNIALSLGKSDETATGCVVFDDITVEKATSDDFSSATNSITLNETTGTLNVANGNFNSVTISDYNYPLTAQNWTVTKGDGLLFNGVINTQENKYSSYVTAYNNLKAEGIEDINNPYYWATYANPKNSRNSTTDSDNIMMLSNIHSSWQKMKSDTISLSADSTYKLNFSFKTYNTSASTSSFTISLYGDDGFKLFESEQLSSNGKWQEYELYIKSFAGASTVYMEIDFGTEDETTQGFAYYDNFDLTTVESSVYENKVSTAEGNGDVMGIVDMSDFYLNLPTNSITDNLSTTSSPAYTGSVSSTDGNNIVGGIVNSDAFAENSLFHIEKETSDEKSKNVFFITSQGVGSYTIQSNFSIDLAADTYYALSFKLKTNFNYYSNDITLDKTKTYSYGVTFGLTGFDYMTNLESNENYETYTIYFTTSTATSAKLYMALVCDTMDTTGSMAIYDIAFETSDETTYTSASDTASKKGYDVNDGKVFVANSTSSDSDDSSDDSSDTTDTDTTPNDNSFNWLLIPTLITALAIVIAIVGSILKNVKIKKVQRKRIETYDRKSSLNIDVVKQKAKKERDAEVEEVKSTISKFQKELDSLEKTHKETVLSLREKDKGQVSKETDKEFKLFAQKRTVIAEKIESLNKQIEEINSAEYLLSLERKVFAKEEMKQRELSKLSKKENKAQEKADKTDKKSK